ncbi:nucleoplasmin ATPase-like isoform X1 [Sinocyclocheilus anshuiensis]|uniref:nucleoplasmin ATPase-like isoform X1 n=1 Tax=Sinocyclocheilus anshuiensis TaxID=1608454 RepID=UPI0007BAB778|nr:PREDICTED: nucleoplasmin ATPase-like isoform X1 [Sinocyclocheilus anshuiensis]
MSKTEKPLSTLWGCELNESNKEESFKTDDTNHQHQLALRTMCLGHTAKDEFNIVELVTGEGNSSARAVPIATLHAKSMPTVNLSGLDLHPPVTFRLKRGSGPVYVGAEHVALEEYSDEEEMDEEVEEEEEDIEESPVKVTKNGAGKRKKPEKGEDEKASDGENPPKKGKGRGRKAQAAKMWMGSGTFPEGRCWTFELGSQISHHGPIVVKLPVNKTVGG